MKTIVILGDGMSDRPVAVLGGKTPLEVAQKPFIDQIAREGRTGLLSTIPVGMPLGSDVANLQVLGYDSRTNYTGRATLEAASIGVSLNQEDVAFRLNLISVADGRIANHSAGHISTSEADQLIQTLNKELRIEKGEYPFRIHTGISFRNLLVLEGGWAHTEVDCIPPHDHLGEAVADLMPKAMIDDAKATATATVLKQLIKQSWEILADHPVNKNRRAQGKQTADSVWPWSPGKRPAMITLKQRFGVHAAVISAVDLVKGLGIYAGADVIEVPGATGLWDTNYEGKAQAALDALDKYDFIYVHVEATDEASHARDPQLKIKCIEMLDQRLVKPILEGLKKRDNDVIVAVLPDHPTFVETGSHSNDPVPVAIRIPGQTPDEVEIYSEKECARGLLGNLQHDQFIRRVITGL